MLAIDFAEISNEERVLIARLAVFIIDAFSPLLQGIPNQSLRSIEAILLEVQILLDDRIDTRKTRICFDNRNGRRCHNLVKGEVCFDPLCEIL